MATLARDWLLNTALLLGGVVVLVLGYGVLTGVTRPPDLPQAPAGATAPADSLDIPNVEILNATAIDGLAARARRYLIDRGVDVVMTGNAQPDGRDSRVLSRTGDLDAARRVARTLGIREARVSSEPSPDLSLDATVLLGSDYATLLPFLPDSTR